ncbi:Cysteine proteinases superfamily protein [Zea mays]|uniref:Cysteine proteinases superfamily protein n=1 Tax=Zea mays TaxID=4577 RepID=A0A1D6EM90_MAIZE|nr:Cysteine proteinases superfamily protein [Zea mays]
MRAPPPRCLPPRLLVGEGPQTCRRHGEEHEHRRQLDDRAVPAVEGGVQQVLRHGRRGAAAVPGVRAQHGVHRGHQRRGRGGGAHVRARRRQVLDRQELVGAGVGRRRIHQDEERRRRQAGGALRHRHPPVLSTNVTWCGVHLFSF